MPKFIVPVDFSETSKNAARYAAHISSLVPDAQVILYNVFDTLEYGSDSSPLSTEGEEDTSRFTLMELALQSVKTELSGITSAPIVCVAEESHRFLDALERYVRENDIQLIVMGITGATRLGQMLMGSNTLNIVKRGIVPVIIVPPDTRSVSAKNVMMLTDFKDVEGTIPMASVKTVLNLFNPRLHIVNVDHEHYVELTDDYKAERAKLERELRSYSPEFYFIRMFDFMEATNQFVEDKKIDLILSFPRRHSFLSHMFKTTNTKKLAYHSHVPIVAISL
ncbi:MAG: universal stress protein [Bacteroidota bacterium]|nr:universal stress protein [Bacteroidota bacterium]MDP4216895.1 universal stress protein [Bacteroidota bacterium]MDP4247319.1 universal stress protein [Bacteroidota bacterium]MDP4253167.1 universal stress protein [Bacteroidota bacterium]MDP4257029.1 universal stress protein [Bacteroidota bacterium]